MNANFVSIIIATYNSGKTLHRCLTAIKEQTVNCYEIIIVDGKSSDNTIQVVREFNELPIVCISEEDEGIYDAWNKGLKLAKGNWITFVGSDDVMSPIWIETLLKGTDNNGYNCISAKINICNNRGKILRVFGRAFDRNDIKRWMMVAHVGSFQHRSLFNEVKPFDIAFLIVGDYDFFLRKRDSIKAHYVDAIIGNVYDGGISTKMNALFEAFRVKQKNIKSNSIKATFELIIAVGAYYKRKVINFTCHR